jgi:hypothetical protein
VDWILLAKDRDRWRDLATTETNLLVPHKTRKTLDALLASQEGLCSMESLNAQCSGKYMFGALSRDLCRDPFMP